MPQTVRQMLDRRVAGLKTYRTEWEEHWRELADHIMPRRTRFTMREKVGKKLNRLIVDSTATIALRQMASGMHAGMTSPARPWFRFTTSDPALREDAEVRAYLGRAEILVRERFQSSNLYNVFHTMYGDLGLIGTAASIIDEDDDDDVNGVLMTTGEYWIATDHRGRTDTLARTISMTVDQIVGKFVFEGNPRNPKPKWDRVTRHVRDQWDRSDYDGWNEVWHVVQPRRDRDPEMLNRENMPFMSVYWEAGADDDRLLRNGGYEENPIIAPRWDVTGNDIYGRSPMMDALADVKMLQVQQKRKGEAIEKQIRPPMNAPTAMANQSYSLLPGAINYVDDATGSGGLRPAFEVNANVQALVEDIRETQERIREASFANTFQMMQQLDQRAITAREVDERHEEKLIELGPVLERLQHEMHSPALDRVIAVMSRRRKLPPAPRSLVDQTTGEGAEIRIEFVGMLAQAQKAVATGGIERLWGFAGNLAAAKPDILDKLDADQTIDEYAEMLGVPVSIVRSDDAVAKLREGREAAMAQQQQVEQAAAVAPAANQAAAAAATLAEADQRGSNVVDLIQKIGVGP